MLGSSISILKLAKECLRELSSSTREVSFLWTRIGTSEFHTSYLLRSSLKILRMLELNTKTRSNKLTSTIS